MIESGFRKALPKTVKEWRKREGWRLANHTPQPPYPYRYFKPLSVSPPYHNYRYLMNLRAL